MDLVADTATASLVSPSTSEKQSRSTGRVPKDQVPMWDEALLDTAPPDAELPPNMYRKYLRRCELKVTAQGSSAADVELINAIKAVVTKMKEADKNLMILPYCKDDASLKPILGIKDIPESISKLKKYFQNASPRMHGGSYFLRTLLAYNTPFSELSEDIKWWLGEHKAGLWLRKVQTERTTWLGFLLYSLRSMDEDRFTRVFSARYSTKVGIRYKAISLGRRTGPYDPQAVIPRAYHLEVAESEAGRVSELLQRDYSSGQNQFPMGIKMRFVPDVNQLMNYNTRGKAAQLATRQLAFEEKMAYANSWEIMDLYSVEKNSGQCLADMITGIPSAKIPHLKVFHSVTPGFRKGTTTFAFIPQLEQEARTMVAALLPYLRAQYGDSVFKFFTSAAADRAQSCEWDPVTNQVISPQDQAVEAATTLDADYHFEGDVEIEMPAMGPAPEGGTAAFAKGSDSVSTFRPASASRSVASSRKKRNPTTTPLVQPSPNIPQRVAPSSARRAAADDASRSSFASAITMETLESTVQETVQKVIAEGLGAMIQEAVSQSMSTHMQHLALSAGNQHETDPPQQARPQGQTRQSASHRGPNGGSSSSRAAAEG